VRAAVMITLSSRAMLDSFCGGGVVDNVVVGGVDVDVRRA
jgi:hypothetical protein